MKFRLILTCLLALPALPAVTLRGDGPTDTPAVTAPPAQNPPPPAGAPDDDTPTELETKMHKLGKAYRRLKKQVADPAANASSLDLVATMQAASKEAETLIPAKADDLPADQKAKFIDDYKAGMKDMEDALSRLRDALSAGKNDDAARIVADIDALMKKDHRAFRKPKKD